MKKNMGNTDRVLRTIIALIAGLLYFSGTVTGTIGIIMLVFAGIFLVTSLVSFCPLYLPFGINTCKTDPEA